MDQRFHEFCTDTGTVVIHIKGNADASTMKEERESLVKALQHDRNEDQSAGEDKAARLLAHEKDLRTALLSSRGIRPLAGLVKRATALANTIAAERKKIAAEKGEIFIPCYGGHDTGDHANTANLIHVLNVRKPYSVLDDLSYKICKQNKLDGGKQAQMAAQLEDVGRIVDETEGMEAEA